MISYAKACRHDTSPCDDHISSSPDSIDRLLASEEHSPHFLSCEISNSFTHTKFLVAYQSLPYTLFVYVFIRVHADYQAVPLSPPCHQLLDQVVPESFPWTCSILLSHYEVPSLLLVA